MNLEHFLWFLLVNRERVLPLTVLDQFALQRIALASSPRHKFSRRF